MPPLQKAFAIAVIVVVLGIQLRAIIPPTFGSWLWPFMDYAMYRQARYHGEAFRVLEIELVPCEGTRPPRLVAPQDVGMPPFRYRAVIDVVAGVEPPAAGQSREELLRLLDGLLRRIAGAEHCEARVLQQTYLNDLEKSGVPDTPRRAIHEWSLGSVTGARRRTLVSTP